MKDIDTLAFSNPKPIQCPENDSTVRVSILVFFLIQFIIHVYALFDFTVDMFLTRNSNTMHMAGVSVLMC